MGPGYGHPAEGAPPSPWSLRLHDRNERIWRQSHYRTPAQIAASEALSETRIRQIIAEATGFYNQPPSDVSGDE